MSVDSAPPQPPTQDVEPHGPIEDNRDVLLDERVGQEGHHPGEAQQEGEQDGVPHGVDDPAPRAHVPDNNNKNLKIWTIPFTSPSSPSLVCSADCLDGDGKVENKDQAWRGDNIGQSDEIQ